MRKSTLLFLKNHTSHTAGGLTTNKFSGFFSVYVSLPHNRWLLPLARTFIHMVYLYGI